MKVLAAQSCLALCDSMDCSPPGSSVHESFQALIWEWFAISFSRGYSWPRDWTWVSCTAGKFFPEQKLQFAFVFHCLQCRRLGFDPWVGKISWRRDSYPFQYSGLENSMDKEACQATVHGVAKSPTWLATFTLTCHFFITLDSGPWTLGSWTWTQG